MLFQNRYCCSVIGSESRSSIKLSAIIIIDINININIIIIIANITMKQLKWGDGTESDVCCRWFERNTGPNTEVIYYVALTSIELLHIFC